MHLALGHYGEELAERYLRRQGYKILERNFRTRLGEIDIIAKDGRTICFIEVKARRSNFSGTPFEAVSRSKQIKLAKVALNYLKFKKIDDCPLRFDVVAVMRSRNTGDTIEILKNAFDLAGYS